MRRFSLIKTVQSNGPGITGAPPACGFSKLRGHHRWSNARTVTRCVRVDPLVMQMWRERDALATARLVPA